MPVKRTLLVVEDEKDIRDLLRFHLEQEGYTVREAESGEDALKRAEAERPALVLLDLMLPGADGLEVCRRLRAGAGATQVPIIMLTAKAAEVDRVLGLEIGADDYITKPFSPNEVVARVRALLRRAHRVAPADSRLSYGSLTVDVDRHLVKIAGEDVKLTAKEFLLLQYLMQHRGRVLSRDLLLSDVWSYSYTGGTRTVDVHVRRLREKVPMLADAIVTVKQFGYKLLDPAPA